MMIALLLIIIVAVFFGITRGIPRLISWFIIYKFNVKIQIKKVTIPRFNIEELSVVKWPLNIKVEKVKLTSSLFNNEEKKLFVFHIYDVRIEKEHSEDVSQKPPYCVNSNFSSNVEQLFKGNSKGSNPFYIKLPPSVVSLAQFFAVRIENLSVMYLMEGWPECLFHSSSERIILEGATRNDTNLALNGKVNGIQLRVLKHSEKLVDEISKKSLKTTATAISDPTLIESSMSCNFYIELQAETKSEMDTISFHIISPVISVNEDVLNFLKGKNVKALPSKKNEINKLLMEEMLRKYWFFLPLKFRFKCDGLITQIVNKLGQIVAKGSFNNFDLQTHFTRSKILENLTDLPDISTEIQCDNLQIHGHYESFISLRQITMQTQFVGDRINIKIETRSLSANYDYNDLQLWLDFMQTYSDLNATEIQSVNIVNEKESNTRNWVYCIGVIFELWDVDFTATIPTPSSTTSAYLSMQHMRYGHAITQGNREFAAELLAELFIIRLISENKLNSTPPKGVVHFKKTIHEVGTAMSIGLCLLQLSSSVMKKTMLVPLQIEMLLDCVQLEWSQAFANFVECCLRYACCIHESPIFKKKTVNSPAAGPSLIFSTIKGKGTSVNIFCNTSYSESNMTRIDTIDFYQNEKTSKISLTGTKCVRFTGEESSLPCLKAEDITNEWAEISNLVVEFVDTEILISIGGKINISWSPTIHMTLFTIAKDVAAFINTNLRKYPRKSQSNDIRLQIMVKGQLKLGAKLSTNHRVDFVTDNVIYLMADKRISVQSPLLKVMFDNNETFLLTESKIAKTLTAPDVKEERESFSEIHLKQNIAWKFKMDTFKMKFHHQYDFSEAFSEDLISIFKWLKKVHKRPSDSASASSSLSADTVIQIKKFIAELSDDPFEVKLRYNYVLMEDEYQESCKRLEALEKKIEETRKTNLQLISGKIEGLYKALQDLNSATYIKRSKKMYSKEPTRTQLFLWEMDDVLIYALADQNFHGKGNIISLMKEIDDESPYPEEGAEFLTLWCRMVSASCSNWKFHLRDYPQSLWNMKDVEIWGRLIGAVQSPSRRAKRTVRINLESPWNAVEVERSLTPMKFYHDLTIESSSFKATYGPCWEPAMAQFNLAMHLVSRPSKDPSRPLPWWDKSRLLFHGRLTLIVEQMTVLLHASLDPYNTSEEMELSWNGLQMDWTNANMVFNGDLSIFVRTASKYDDARLLHFPNLKLSVKITWICQGNPNDHHAVMLCAPDKLPEYSINQEHDSYRVFRSEKVKLNISLETKLRKNEIEIAPVQLLFYGSTLRWFENLKFILSGVSRPTRKGILFNNILPRKPQLSRHYESIHLSLSFQRIDVRYWMSVRVKKGFHMTGERLSLSSEHCLALNSISDGLLHRSQTNWSICFLNTELCQVQIWLQSVIDTMNERDESTPTGDEPSVLSPPVEKFYFLHLTKVSYMREMLESLYTFSPSQGSETKDTPNHRLVVHNLKGVWTTSTRDVMFALYDSWNKTSLMKQNLSPNILKNVMHDFSSFNTPQKPRTYSVDSTGVSPAGLLQVNVAVQNTPSPRTRLQSDHASNMLQQLVAEAENHFVVYANDCSTPEPRDQSLQKFKSVCTTDDVICKTWLIELENSQVLFRGCETEGYVIVSAAHSQISQRIHRPTWKDQSLVAKTTWTGSLECMQYYATVNEGHEVAEMDNIMWLTVDNIEEKDCSVINEVTDIVGSGQSVGGVVSETVGTTDTENESLQLQRIVSRCRCEFFYVSYGETGLDSSLLEEVQPPPNAEEGLWKTVEEPADTFNLRHYDLCASTNSLQYNMVLDILNNLLLYADPHKKESLEALARMRFKLQLHSSDDQRKPIITLQNRLRFQLSQLRFLEKEIYLLQRKMDKKATNELIKKIASFEIQVTDCKEKVTVLSDELAMRIHLYNETRVSFNRKLSAAKGDGKEKSLMRMNEVYFRKAQWRLTEADGQLAICQLDLSNFLYSKKTFSDDITEHLLELGFINISNLLPNQVYTNVLAPSEIKSSMPVNRQKTLRIYCRQKPPCGGISIIQHLEINVVPLKIGLSDYLIQRIMMFCFPYNQPDEDDSNAGKHRGSKSSLTKPQQSKVSNFYVDLQRDEVEIMKLRAEQNKLFVYIKITDVPVDFSYKGKKGNIFSMENTPLLIRTIEYHSVTWTWLDLLMAVKQTSKSLIKQAIRNKLNLPRLMKPDEETTESNEEEKKRLIFGSKYMQYEKRAGKKNLFRSNK